jgi:hypothetical protein
VHRHGFDVRLVEASGDRNDCGDTADLGSYPCTTAFNDVADARWTALRCSCQGRSVDVNVFERSGTVLAAHRIGAGHSSDV